MRGMGGPPALSLAVGEDDIIPWAVSYGPEGEAPRQGRRQAYPREEAGPEVVGNGDPSQVGQRQADDSQPDEDGYERKVQMVQENFENLHIKSPRDDRITRPILPEVPGQREPSVREVFVPMLLPTRRTFPWADGHVARRSRTALPAFPLW